MDLYLLFLLIVSLIGIILLLFIPFNIQLSGSLSSDCWFVQVLLMHICLRLVPGMKLELLFFGSCIKSFGLPLKAKKISAENMNAISSEKKERDKRDQESRINLYSILRMPVTIKSVSISGRIGCENGADTGQLYGLISAISGALSCTRVQISFTPDFSGSYFSLILQLKIRVKSVFHLVSYLPSLWKG
jgi:hypothetical protein